MCDNFYLPITELVYVQAGIQNLKKKIKMNDIKQLTLFSNEPQTTEPMEYDALLGCVITENNHPCRHDIIGKSKEALLNIRPYVLIAISAWKENRYNATPDRVAYNINYFEVELKIVDKELSRF